MELSKEFIKNVKAAKTPEDLLELAKSEDITLSIKQATEYFEKLNAKQGEISDNELDNVAGGGCESSHATDGRLYISRLDSCKNFYRSSNPKDQYGEYCQNCVYAENVDGTYLLCNNEINKK